MDNKQAHLLAGQPSPAPVDDGRREALRRIGKFGAYTAPVLIAMLAADKAPAVTDLGCT